MLPLLEHSRLIRLRSLISMLRRLLLVHFRHLIYRDRWSNKRRQERDGGVPAGGSGRIDLQGRRSPALKTTGLRRRRSRGWGSVPGDVGHVRKMRTVTEIKRNREEILGFKIDGVCEEKFSLAKGVRREMKG